MMLNASKCKHLRPLWTTVEASQFECFHRDLHWGSEKPLKPLSTVDYTDDHSSRVQPYHATGKFKATGFSNAFQRVESQEWLDGEIVMMSNWAVYVLVKSKNSEEVVGILPRQHLSPTFAEEVVRGCHVRVRIKELDLESRRLLLTMEPFWKKWWSLGESNWKGIHTCFASL